MNTHVRLLVGWYLGKSVIILLKGWEVTPPCSYPSPRCIIQPVVSSEMR